MVKLHGFIYTVIVLLCLINCKSDATLSAEEARNVENEVTTTLRQYHQDIQREGVLAELKYLDSSDSFSWMAPGFSSPLGYDSVASILKTMAPLYSRIEHSWDSLTVTAQSDTKAMYHGTITSILTNLQGKTDTMKLKEEGVVVKRKEGWKLLSGKTRRVH